MKTNSSERGRWCNAVLLRWRGLGFKSTRGGPRDGSFAYYVSEPIVENDMKGIGPLVLAGIEMQKLLKLPMATKAAINSPKGVAEEMLIGSTSH